MKTREWLSVTMGRLGDGLRKARVSAWVDAANAHVRLWESALTGEDALRRRLGTMTGDTIDRRLAKDLAESRKLLALQCQTQEFECLARATDAAVEGLVADMRDVDAHPPWLGAPPPPEGLRTGVDINAIGLTLENLYAKKLGLADAFKRIAAEFVAGDKVAFMKRPHDLFDRVVMETYPGEMGRLCLLATAVGRIVDGPDHGSLPCAISDAYVSWSIGGLRESPMKGPLDGTIRAKE